MMRFAPTRRSILGSAIGSALALGHWPLMSFAQEASGQRKKVLFFTRSQGFPHSVVTRKSADEPAFAEALFRDAATQAGYDVTVSKDGRLFEPDRIGQWDAFAFYTTGILTDPPNPRWPGNDNTPPMSAAGKAALLQAIEAGKGFIGFHSASDTFLSPRKDEMLRPVDAPDYIDPYIVMLGGEFTSHGSQQRATLRVGSSTFPGLEDLKEFEMHEEWYGLYNLDPKMHVILIQDTTTMSNSSGQRERQYQRDPYPATWARQHGQGRVFYTSMGHREDVWTNPIFQKILLASLAWTTRKVDAAILPNLAQACPALAATLKPSP